MDKQIELFCYESSSNPGEAPETILDRCGISYEIFNEMRVQTSFERVMKKMSKQLNIIMKIPSIDQSLVDAAENGDIQAQKIAYQMTGRLTPEVNVVNNSMLEEMDDDQLRRHLAGLQALIPKQITDES